MPFFITFTELRITLQMVFEEVETVADSRDPLGTFTRYFFAIADNVVALPTERIGEVPTLFAGKLTLV